MFEWMKPYKMNETSFPLFRPNWPDSALFPKLFLIAQCKGALIVIVSLSIDIRQMQGWDGTQQGSGWKRARGGRGEWGTEDLTRRIGEARPNKAENSRLQVIS